MAVKDDRIAELAHGADHQAFQGCMIGAMEGLNAVFGFCFGDFAVVDRLAFRDDPRDNAQARRNAGVQACGAHA